MARLTNLIGLVGFEPVQRIAILKRVNCHGFGAEFNGSTKRTNGDFAAISDQDLLEHAHLSGRKLRGRGLGNAAPLTVTYSSCTFCRSVHSRGALLNTTSHSAWHLLPSREASEPSLLTLIRRRMSRPG